MRFALFLSCWLLARVALAQPATAPFPDQPTITQTSVGRAKIGMPVAELRRLYKGCTFTPAHTATYGFDEAASTPDAVIVSAGKQKLFLYYVGYDVVNDKVIARSTVAGILVFHPAYQTARGIHVGSTSGQLRATLPTVRVVPDMMAPSIEVAFVGEIGGAGITYVFRSQGPIGKYVVADEPVKITATTAKISWIQLSAGK